MDAVIEALALVPMTMAGLIFVVGGARALTAGADVRPQLARVIGLTLEFLLAAGLIRLGSVQTFSALGMVGAILVIRQVVGAELRMVAREA
jgi:uncharacterized membrane protein